jgi:hypothetical protein
MDPDVVPEPAIFVIDLQDANNKLILKKNFFGFVLFEGTITSFFKDNKSKRSHKTVGIKVFHTILLDDRRIRIREAQKHVNPEHWCKSCLPFRLSSS